MAKTPKPPAGLIMLGLRRRGFETTRSPAPASLAISAGVTNLIADSVSTSPLNVQIAASRTSGPTPLSVFFDAYGTTHTSLSAVAIFRQVGYAFDFGAEVSGTWSYSGQPKRYQRGGPAALCVFENPGTYIVKVKGRDPSGYTSQDEITISAIDADVYYAGKTYYLCNGSDTTGADTNETVLTSVSAYPTIQSGYRYLLKSDEDFRTVTGGLSLAQKQDTQIGRFGSGAKPITNGVTIQGGNPNSSGLNWPDRCVVYGLDVRGAVTGPLSFRNVLLYQLDVNAGSSGRPITIGTDVDYYYDSPSVTATVKPFLEWPQHAHIVECVTRGGGETNGIYALGRSICVLGCDVDPAREHCVRMPLFYQNVVAHNYLHGIETGIRHAFKAHARGTASWNDIYGSAQNPASSHMVVSYNDVGEDPEPSVDWGVAIAPQNDSTSEGVQYVIAERNDFGYNFRSEIALGGRYLITRGNAMAASIGGTVGVTTGAHSGGIPSGWAGPYFADSDIVTEDPD